MVSWLIYAFGSGWGHLNRAIALARSLSQWHVVHILTNSPYATVLQGALLKGTIIQVHSLASDVTPEAARRQVCHWLDTLSYDGLVVDTFPRGLLGELAARLSDWGDRPRILIHRDLNPHYVATHHLTEFVQCHYERLWIPGEGATVPFAALPQARHSAPWLVRQSGELPDRSVVCSRLGCAPDRPSPLVLLLVSGQPQEQAFFAAVGEAIARTFPQVTLRLLAAHPPSGSLGDRWIPYYPAMDLLWLADVVIGGGGYNTVYECLSLGVPLIAIPWKRLYDRQAHRLQRLRPEHPTLHIACSVPEVLSALQHLLTTPLRTSPSRPPAFKNGAIAPAVLQDFAAFVGHGSSNLIF